MAKSNIKATLNHDFKKVWDTVTDVKNFCWRSDLKYVEVLDESNFIEYTKDGFATNFKVTEKNELKKWEFDIENQNIKGHWTGIFYDHNGKTTIDFTEDVKVKKFYLLPFIGKYLRKQQWLYFNDLKTYLDSDKKA